MKEIQEYKSAEEYVSAKYEEFVNERLDEFLETADTTADDFNGMRDTEISEARVEAHLHESEWTYEWLSEMRSAGDPRGWPA